MCVRKTYLTMREELLNLEIMMVDREHRGKKIACGRRREKKVLNQIGVTWKERSELRNDFSG